jgi:hypothetical protein
MLILHPNLAIAVLLLLFAACRGQDSGVIQNKRGQASVSTEAEHNETIAAPPTEVTHTQLYATADGDTHFREVAVPLKQLATSPPAQPSAQSELQPATTIRHVAYQPNWGAHDRDNNIFHNASSRRFLSVRHGDLYIKVSDGETRRFQAGDLVEILDMAPSKGHITWIGKEPVVLLFSNFP